MKGLIISILALMSSTAYARDPMPPCVSQAQTAARIQAEVDYEEHAQHSYGVSVSYRDSQQIAWQVQFEDQTTDSIVQYQVIAALPSCEIREVRPSTPIFDSPVNTPSAKEKQCREYAMSACEYRQCMGLFRGMCK